LAARNLREKLYDESGIRKTGEVLWQTVLDSEFVRIHKGLAEGRRR
jgi:hypothetical protein